MAEQSLLTQQVRSTLYLLRGFVSQNGRKKLTGGTTTQQDQNRQIRYSLRGFVSQNGRTKFAGGTTTQQDKLTDNLLTERILVWLLMSTASSGASGSWSK